MEKKRRDVDMFCVRRHPTKPVGIDIEQNRRIYYICAVYLYEYIHIYLYLSIFIFFIHI